MKSRITLLLLCAFSVLTVIFPGPSRAVEGQVGATMAYEGWQPSFIDLLSGKARPFGSPLDRTDAEGSFLMGPYANLNLGGDWTLNALFLFGLSRNELSYTSFVLDINFYSAISGNPLNNTYLQMGDSKVRRYDFSLGLEKKLDQRFGFYVDLRYAYNDGEGSCLMISGFNASFEEFSSWRLGPVPGLRFRHEFNKNIILTANAGIPILFGSFKMDRSMLDSGGSPNPSWFFLFSPHKYNVSYLNIGLELGAALSYLVDKFNLVLTLGFRYQMLPHISLSDTRPRMDFNYEKGWMGGKIDHIYGGNFSVGYKF